MPRALTRGSPRALEPALTLCGLGTRQKFSFLWCKCLQLGQSGACLQ